MMKSEDFSSSISVPAREDEEPQMDAMDVCDVTPELPEDIEIGVSMKSLHQEPPYDSIVVILLQNHPNHWVNRAARRTALDMMEVLAC